MDYRDEFGNVLVKNEYSTEDGYSLGYWVATIEPEKHLLDQDQIKKLDDIGFIWEPKKEAKWEEMFNKVSKLKEKTKGFYASDENIKAFGKELFTWINHTKAFYKKGDLSSERINKLNSIKFIWETEDLWDERFENLKKIHEEKGKLPINFKFKDGVKLSSWIVSNRNNLKKGKLSSERKKKLLSIGIVENKYQDDWDKSFNVLKIYFDRFGDTDVPLEYLLNNMKLGYWVARQKKLYEKGTFKR